jgi:hypothetical protein
MKKLPLLLLLLLFNGNANAVLECYNDQGTKHLVDGWESSSLSRHGTWSVCGLFCEWK